MKFAALARLVAVIFLLALPAGAGGPQVDRYYGVARSPSGQFLYKETHSVTKLGDRPVKATTVYYDEMGRPIGRLDSDFAASPYLPSYEFVDARRGLKERVRLEGETLTLQHGDQRKAIRVDGELPLVVGQGLHHYARLNLERLARESTTVRFAIPSRLDTYTFRIRPLASPAPGVVRLRIELNSALLRMIAPDLEVDYESSTKRLLRYRGVSNLEASDGSAQEAVIEYRYGASS